jgi:GNAT superfamily N-acetyltransferase
MNRDEADVLDADVLFPLSAAFVRRAHIDRVEEPFRRRGLGTYLLPEVEKLARENGATMVLTSAGDRNIGFFKKNGYLLSGELKDVSQA